jgi:hypothetical protein
MRPAYVYSRFPEFLRPFSYNHLLFNPTLAPFPVKGLGVPGVSGKADRAAPGPRGLGVPYEDLLAPFSPPPAMVFCSRGLALGENGDPAGLPDADRGEVG